MNVKEITGMYDSATKLMNGALHHVLSELPEHKYNFEHPVRLPHENPFTGEISSVGIIEMHINDHGNVMVKFIGMFSSRMEEAGLYEFYDDAPYWLLQAITPEVLSGITPYLPQPQTLLVIGTDSVNKYLETLSEQGNKDKIHDFVKAHRPDIVVRSFCTEQERNAYMMGVEDANGNDTALIDNSKGDLKINWYYE